MVSDIFKSKIEPEWNKNKLNIIKEDKMIKNDYIVWTGNPTKLIKNLMVHNRFQLFKDDQITNMLTDINENTYLQIFSDKINISKYISIN